MLSPLHKFNIASSNFLSLIGNTGQAFRFGLPSYVKTCRRDPIRSIARTATCILLSSCFLGILSRFADDGSGHSESAPRIDAPRARAGLGRKRNLM